VALSVTLTPTGAGDVVAVTSRGHQLTGAEQRFTCCDPTLTPVLIERPTAPDHEPGPVPALGPGSDPATARILAIAEALLGQRIPLAVGRTARTATPAQRRALAVRDKGCVIPGCGVPAEICQVHHLHEWADGGPTDLANEVLLCWAHHRQVELNLWRIEPRAPGPGPHPDPGAPPGTPWPANNNAPWTITRQPRTRWRL
jgi:hypothetical protein